MADQIKVFIDPTIPHQPLSMSELSLKTALEYFDKLNPRVILEIGTARGGTLYQWMKHATPGATIVTVDLLLVNNYADPEPPGLRDEWIAYGRDHGHTVHVITADSTKTETVARVRELVPVVDWLFIDGGHDYRTVLSDWVNYSPLVRPGGIVGMHDVLAHGVPSSQVDVLWGEIKNSHTVIECGHAEGDAGIGLVLM